MPGSHALPITAYAVCNGLSRTTDEVAAGLAASRSGLGPPPLPLSFETVCGVVTGELPDRLRKNPCAASLPLLEALLRGTTGPVRVELDGEGWCVDLDFEGLR